MPSIPGSIGLFFPCRRYFRLRFCGGILPALAWLGLSATQAQTTNYALGTSTLLVGPGAGANSVVLAVRPATGTWMATNNATWLHLSPANQSGAGSTNVVFNCDANPGATRAGTLTIAGQTLTVTQAGSTYVAAAALTALVPGLVFPVSSSGPIGVGVDGAGNAYSLISDINTGCWFLEWILTNNSMVQVGLPGLIEPANGFAGNVLAADGAGDLYIADYGADAIKERIAANNSVTTLVSMGLNRPSGVAVDGAGNVYIADTGNNAIKEWTAGKSNAATLVSAGLSYPTGVAADGAGNVYIAEPTNNTILEWTAANSNLTTLVSSGLYHPQGVAVDGAGNVYIDDAGNFAIKKRTAADGNVSTLLSQSYFPPEGVALDGSGNVYVVGGANGSLEEWPYAFVDTSARWESAAAGNDALPGVLPATQNLLPPFAPSSDQVWLTITGITNGVVSFSFGANSGAARTAHIGLLGQIIPITQGVMVTRPTLTGWQMPGKGVFQFGFTNTPGAAFTVVSTTNLALPWSNWTVAGRATNTVGDQFQFTSEPTTNDAQRFYGVRSP